MLKKIDEHEWRDRAMISDILVHFSSFSSTNRLFTNKSIPNNISWASIKQNARGTNSFGNRGSSMFMIIDQTSPFLLIHHLFWNWRFSFGEINENK